MSTPDASRYRCELSRAAVIPLVVLLALALFFSHAAAAQPAAGGRYEEISVSDQKKPITVAMALRRGTFAGNEQQDLDRYYTQYALPRWTRLSTITLLPRYRNELRNELYQAKVGQVHAHLAGLVLTEMRKYMEKPEYHPATRYNAMLMIGSLNAAEIPKAGSPPTPYPQALPELLKAVAPGANDPRLPEGVRSAALTGLIRHARIGIPPAQQAAVSNAMLPLVRAATVPGPAGEGRAWMRGQAAEVLGWLRSAGQGGAVASGLTAIVSDTGLPFSTRCKAAEALGKLNYAGAQFDAEAMATALGQLALDACNAEKTAADNGKGPYRRRLLQCVNAALAGVNGLPRAGSPSAKLAPLRTVLKEMQDAISARSLDNTQLLTSMAPSYDKLTKLFP